MKYRQGLTVVLAIALVMLCLSVPVQAQEDEPHLVYLGGTVNVEPMSSFAFNWSWWGLDEGISLSFCYTTNNHSYPLHCSVNNTKYTILEVYDYFFLYQWNSTDFPTTTELWWFTFINAANVTVTLEVSVSYDIPKPAQGIDFLLILFVIGAVTWGGTIIVLGVRHYIRTRRERADPEGEVCS